MGSNCPRELAPPTFFIIGPTAVGKSELGAEVAARVGAEIVSADAYQIYRGLDLLTGKPEAATLKKVPHHLISSLPLSGACSASRFAEDARTALETIRGRGGRAIVVGGSGLYLRALIDGLDPLPEGSAELRTKLGTRTLEQLNEELARLDPETAATIDRRNRRRVERALEVCLLTGSAASKLRKHSRRDVSKHGVLLLRERDDLYQRINRRVEEMFARGVVEEVRRAGALSETSAKTLGLAEIHALLRGELSEPACVASIAQQTRRYARRQLTWFRHQVSFESLNLSKIDAAEAVEWIVRKANRAFAQG